MRLPAVLVLIASAAHAQPSLPNRDVDVTYGAAENVTQRWRFRAADQKLRLDPPTAGLHMIVDYAAHTMAGVNDTDRTVMMVPAPATPSGRGTRAGTDTLLGQTCTVWQQMDSQNQPTQTCYTTDGVMLRAQRGSQTLVEATAIAYASADPSVYAIPSGYTRLTK